MPSKIFGFSISYAPFVLCVIVTLVFAVLIIRQMLLRIWDDGQVLPRAVSGEFVQPKKYFNFIPLFVISCVLTIIFGIASL